MEIDDRILIGIAVEIFKGFTENMPGRNCDENFKGFLGKIKKNTMARRRKIRKIFQQICRRKCNRNFRKLSQRNFKRFFPKNPEKIPKELLEEFKSIFIEVADGLLKEIIDGISKKKGKLIF